MTKANLVRWQNADDPRRKKLQERNQSVRKGSMPYTDREWMRERYEDKKMSLRDIAREAKCAMRTIVRWMQIHSIQTRDSATGLRLIDTTGAASPRWKGGARNICPTCGGSKFKISKQCSKCYLSTVGGAGNANWSGLADVMTLVRSWVSQHWRPLIHIRDNYTCRKCGDSRGGNLHAHHINLLSTIVGEKYKLWKPDITTPESRLEFVSRLVIEPDITSLENGITLCKPCHRDVHKTIKFHHSLPRKSRECVSDFA